MRADASHIQDLPGALRFLESIGDPPLGVRTAASPCHEVAAAYAAYGGGAPLPGRLLGERTVLFENVGPHADRIVLGVFASRTRCAQLLGASDTDIARRLLAAVRTPIAPVYAASAPCQEVIEEIPDLGRLPILTAAPGDAGPYITMGVVLAAAENGSGGNISIHRLCVQSADTLTLWMVPGRDLEQLWLAARARGRALPISINIGLDPAIYVAAACTGPLTPPGYNELGVAGAIRGRAVELARCRTVAADCIARAEYVIEGEIGDRVIPESAAGGKSLPEFLGYDGAAHPGLPVIRVTAITRRRAPLFQAVIGPGLEQSHLLAFGMEAAVVDFLLRHGGPPVGQVRAHPGGGGQLLLFVQMQKRGEQDDAAARRGGAALLAAFRMIKQVVLVDEDVDVDNDADLWWAMATRFQAGRDILAIPNVQGFPLDPSQSPDFHPALSGVGATDKVVFDCTVPFRLRARFLRSQFGTFNEAILNELREGGS